MLELGRIFLAVACVLTPSLHRQRYRDEWVAEHAVVHRAHGLWAGLVFAIEVMMSSPRVALALREGGNLAFLEASLAALALSIPTAFFAIFGLTSGQPLVVVTQGGLVLGLLAAGVGMWRDERGLFMSRASRFGLILAVVSAVAITLVNRLTDVNNPALEGPHRVLIPSIVAQVGLAVLFLSSYTGRLRTIFLKLGLSLTTVGPAAWVVVEILNTVLVSSWTNKLFHFVSVPPMIAVAWASFVMLRRPVVIETPATV